MQISRQTRADEVVKMILSSYGSDEPPEKFVLVESLSDSEGKRFGVLVVMCFLPCFALALPELSNWLELVVQHPLTNQSKPAVVLKANQE